MRRAAQLKLRTSLAGALALAPFFVLAGPVAPLCAAPGSAALVVDTGDASYSYCVALPDDRVSGIELIQLAGEQHDLQYRLGYGGGAVCQLQGVGPDGQDCFADHPNFWGYWRGSPSGGWTWSGTGAGSTTVEPGDVEGWSWGSGQDGSTHQQPPATSYSSVCGAPEPSNTEAPEDESPDRSKPERAKAAAPSGPAVAPATSGDESGETDEPARRDPTRKRGRDKQQRREERPSPVPTSEPAAGTQPAVATRSPGSGEGGAPAAGLAGLGATALLGAAGVLVARRRKRQEL
jgi:LPXTG-motif cell wall-anchored protein